MCVRIEAVSQVITWASPSEAAEADRVLYDRPCGPGCEGSHIRAWCEPGQLHLQSSCHEARPSTDLRIQLLAAGYQRPMGSTEASVPSCWPAPSILNRPLRPEGPPVDTDDLRFTLTSPQAYVLSAVKAKLTGDQHAMSEIFDLIEQGDTWRLVAVVALAE
jgi:hypothetical protein